MSGYAFIMPEFCCKVHPFLASIYVDRTRKQSINIWKNSIQQRNQIVFQNSLYLGILSILAIAVFQQQPNISSGTYLGNASERSIVQLAVLVVLNFLHDSRKNTELCIMH